MSFPLFVSHKKLRKDAVQFSADCVLHKRKKKKNPKTQQTKPCFIQGEVAVLSILKMQKQLIY